MPHIHEKIDFTVETFVVHKNKVLLRKHDKYGIWLSIGGHIELDEDPNQAAIREVKEEVGLDVELWGKHIFNGVQKMNGKELLAPVGLNRHNVSPTHEHVALIYYAKSDTDNVIPEKETDEWKWCSEDEIDKLGGIQDNIVHWAKQALKEVK